LLLLLLPSLKPLPRIVTLVPPVVLLVEGETDVSSGAAMKLNCVVLVVVSIGSNSPSASLVPVTDSLTTSALSVAAVSFELLLLRPDATALE
jgi:hypothetical protein